MQQLVVLCENILDFVYIGLKQNTTRTHKDYWCLFSLWWIENDKYHFTTQFYVSIVHFMHQTQSKGNFVTIVLRKIDDTRN